MQNDGWRLACGFTTVLLLGCNGGPGRPCGDGTAERDGGCASVAPDGGIMPRPGDVLLVREAPDVLQAVVIRGSGTCFVAHLLHADGTLEAPSADESSFSIAVDNAAVARPLPSSDCRQWSRTSGALSGLGVLGVASGTTRATVTYTSGGASVTGVLGVRVAPYHLELQPTLNPTLPVGRVEPFRWNARAFDGTTSVAVRDDVGPWVPPSTVRVTVGDASVIELSGTAPAPGMTPEHMLRALRIGRTELTVHYGIDGERQVVVPVEVVNAGTLVTLLRIEAVGEARATSPTGFCYRARVRGLFERPPEHLPEDYVTNETIAWEAHGALTLVENGNAALFCPSRSGESEVRACVGAMCVNGTVAHFAQGEIVAFEVTPAAVDVVAGPVGSLPGEYPICVPIRAALRRADGTSVDVTHSRLFSGSAASPYSLRRGNDESGAPQRNAAADPCYVLSGFNACPSEQTADVVLWFSYSGQLPDGSTGAELIHSVRASVSNIQGGPGCR